MDAEPLALSRHGTPFNHLFGTRKNMGMTFERKIHFALVEYRNRRGSTKSHLDFETRDKDQISIGHYSSSLVVMCPNLAMVKS